MLRKDYVESLINLLLQYYDVENLIMLGEKMNMSPQTFSNWKSRESVSAIKKKCRELGIYDDIFSDVTNNIQNIDSLNGGMNANVLNNGDMNNNEKKENIDSIIPETIIDDLNTLFKIANEKNKTDMLIDQIDDFIYKTKKELRK